MPESHASQTKPALKLNVPIEISREMVVNQIITAIEGGSNYWAEFRFFNKDGKAVRGLLDLLPSPNDYSDICGIIWVREVDESTGDLLSEVPINLLEDHGGQYPMGCAPWESVVAGLRLMAEKHPRHFADVIADGGDAETADVFMQMVCLRELRYG